MRSRRRWVLALILGVLAGFALPLASASASPRTGHVAGALAAEVPHGGSAGCGWWRGTLIAGIECLPKDTSGQYPVRIDVVLPILPPGQHYSSYFYSPLSAVPGEVPKSLSGPVIPTPTGDLLSVTWKRASASPEGKLIFWVWSDDDKTYPRQPNWGNNPFVRVLDDVVAFPSRGGYLEDPFPSEEVTGTWSLVDNVPTYTRSDGWVYTDADGWTCPSGACSGDMPVEPPPDEGKPEPVCDVSMLDPSSWGCAISAGLHEVTAAVGGVVSKLEELLVPDPSAWGVQDVIDQARTRPPVSIILDLADGVGAARAAMTPSGDCARMPDFGLGFENPQNWGGGHTLPCRSELEGRNSPLLILRGIVAAGMTVLTALVVWRMLEGAIKGDS